MTRNMARRTIPAIALAGLVALGFTWTGRAQETGAGQKVGEKIDEAVKDLKGGLSKAGGAVKDRYARAKTAANNLGIEARVYSRIHWDKTLNEASVELDGEQAGVIILSGQVSDAAAKRRAVELAETTVGVTRVVDQLSTRPAGTTTTAPRAKGDR